MLQKGTVSAFWRAFWCVITIGSLSFTWMHTFLFLKYRYPTHVGLVYFLPTLTSNFHIHILDRCWNLLNFLAWLLPGIIEAKIFLKQCNWSAPESMIALHRRRSLSNLRNRHDLSGFIDDFKAMRWTLTTIMRV